MNVTDPIADMLTRIRNGNTAGKDVVSMPSSKVLVVVARVIAEEGYIEGYAVEDTKPQKTLHVTLKYGARHARIIRGIKRISKPGLRIYSKAEDLPRVLRHFHVQGHDVRPRRPQARRRRRSHRLHLVTHGRIGKETPCPALARSLSRFPPESL